MTTPQIEKAKFEMSITIKNKTDKTLRLTFMLLSVCLVPNNSTSGMV